MSHLRFLASFFLMEQEHENIFQPIQIFLEFLVFFLLQCPCSYLFQQQYFKTYLQQFSPMTQFNFHINNVLFHSFH